MMGVIHENQYRPSYNKYRRPHYDQKMDRFQMMKSKYNNKYGMDNKMDMEKFEKMYDMVKQMKHQSYKMDEMRDSSPIAAFRSAINFDNNNHKSMDFNKMANFFKNFRSKRAADTG